MSQQAFYFDGTRCTGCKTCQMACKDYKNIDLGISFRHVYEVTIGDTVKDADGAFSTTCVSYPLSMSCNHCDSPAVSYTHLEPWGVSAPCGSPLLYKNGRAPQGESMYNNRGRARP